MNFSEEVKSEILKIEHTSLCCKKALLAAFLRTAGSIEIRNGNIGVTMATDIEETAKEVSKVIKDLYGTGLPESFEISGSEVYDAIIDTINAICNAVRQVLNKTNPDLVADIMNDGLYLAGGGSKLAGFDKKLSQYLGVAVHPMDDPAHSVVKGAAAALKNPELLKNVDYRLRSIKELEVE